MAYYYVRTHADGTGTATGDGGRNATLQTGDWDTTFSATTQYYATQALAFAATTTPVAGDFICISDIHAESTASLTILKSAAAGLTADGLTYISVDDTEIETAKAGAAAQIITTSSDINFGDANYQKLNLHGLYFYANSDQQAVQENIFVKATNCTFKVDSSGNRGLRLGGISCYALLSNCTIIADGAVSTYPFQITNGSTLIMIGGSVISDQSTVNGIVVASGTNGGMTAEFIGVDLSVVNAAGDNLVQQFGNSQSDDTCNIQFHRCKIGASSDGFVERDLYGSNKRVEAYNCAATSEAADYQFFVTSDQHIAEDDTATYRNESTAFTDSGTKVSIKVVTAAHCSRGNYFYFDLPARFAALSSASTDTLRVFLNSDTALTDNDVWCEMVYPDGTNKHLANFVTTAGADPLGAGTTLTTDSTSTYTAGKTNKYQIDLATSGDVGADCVPILRVYVGKASLTVFFDTTVDVVA